MGQKRPSTVLLPNLYNSDLRLSEHFFDYSTGPFSTTLDVILHPGSPFLFWMTQTVTHHLSFLIVGQ